MYVPTGSKKYTCQACRRKIDRTGLERIFQARLLGFLSSPDEVAEALAQSDRMLSEKRQLLEELKREDDKVRAEMDKLYRLYIDDFISPDGFKERNRPLEERRSQLALEIPEREAEVDVLSIRNLSSA